MPTLSWANIAAGASMDPTTGLPYNLKPARKSQKSQPATDKCTGHHCERDPIPCPSNWCTWRIHDQLVELQADNTSLTEDCDRLLNDIKLLRADILRECRTENFNDEDMEASRVALGKTLQSKAQEVDCFCVACELKTEIQHRELLRQRFKAAQIRHTILKQYRRANDKDTLKRISSSFTNTGKYFTPVGSLHAGGATVLRPTLQMQTSYDVAALTTNTMSTRPLKVAWKDKPKPSRKH